MTTALNIITDALADLGAIQAGETPNAADQNYALRQLNLMLDSWSTESIAVFCNSTVQFLLVAAQQNYPLGAGGTLDVNSQVIPRPAFGIRAWVQINGQDQPVMVLDEAQWDAIPLKSTTGNFPDRSFLDPQFPQATLKVWPVPTINYPFFYEFQQQLNQFATVNTVVSFPPGYESALGKNLACRMPGFRIAPSPDLVATARETFGNIKRLNGVVRDIKMRNDFQGQRTGLRTLSPYTNRPIGSP